MYPLQVLDSAVLFDLGTATVTDTFAQYMAGLLGLKTDQITVNDLVVAPGSAVSTSASAFIPLQVEFTAQSALNPTVQARVQNPIAQQLGHCIAPLIWTC